MSPNLARTYYHGKYAWQDHALDIAEACEANTSLQRQNLSLQARTSRAEREHHEEQLRQGAAQREELSGIRGDLQEMTEEFRLGMSLVVDRLDEQIQLFSQAVVKLDEINRTLKIPRTTEANELYSQGELWFRQGLYEESLDAYLKAEEIYQVHYLLQFRIGSLFLEGRNRISNVIDLTRAEPHLLLATRYADVQDSSDPRARRICGDAYFRAGKAAYLLGEERRKVGDLESVRACLQRALGHMANSVQRWPEHTATLYWQAKCHALLGQTQQALDKFAILSDRDRRYCADAMEDRDFETLRNHIQDMFRRAVESPGPQARQVDDQLKKAAEALDWAKRSSPESDTDIARITVLENELSKAQQRLPGLDADIEYLSWGSLRVCEELDGITERTFKTKTDSLKQQLSLLNSRKSYCENGIDSYKKEMAKTEGSAGIGCLFVFIFGVIFGVCFLLLMISIADEQGHYDLSPGQITLVLFVLLAWLVLGNATGLWITRKSKNSPLQEKVDAAISALAEWNRTAPSAIQQLNAALEAQTKQMEQFSLWRKSNPIAVLRF
jgi:tetratricopeptide (TPR) repeat protein